MEISQELAGKRIDKFLCEQYSEFSRSYLQSCVKAGKIKVSGSIVKPNYVLRKGDVLEVGDIKREEVKLKEEKFDLNVLHEEKSFIVIEKPAGMVVHPGEGQSHVTGTVANKVAGIVDEGVGAKMRPGIVHRLDQDTSGLMIIAKTQETFDYFTDVFKERKVEKKYLTLLCAVPNPEHGVVDAPIGRNVKLRKEMAVVGITQGKPARSEYLVKQIFDSPVGEVALVEVKIETGRTHQIRVHMTAIGHPVVGDDVYGKRSYNKNFLKHFGLRRQFLHAYSLKFKSPETGDLVEVQSDLPEDLESVIQNLS